MRSPKQKIPATVRNKVWDTYIGPIKKQSRCLCCDTENITFSNFECGHVKSEATGGKITISNLRPICSLCNKSMGIKNMEAFMASYGFTKPRNWNGCDISTTLSIYDYFIWVLMKIYSIILTSVKCIMDTIDVSIDADDIVVDGNNDTHVNNDANNDVNNGTNDDLGVDAIREPLLKYNDPPYIKSLSPYILKKIRRVLNINREDLPLILTSKQKYIVLCYGRSYCEECLIIDNIQIPCVKCAKYPKHIYFSDLNLDDENKSKVSLHRTFKNGKIYCTKCRKETYLEEYFNHYM